MRYIKATVIPSNILNLPTLGDAQSGVISEFNTDLTNALNKLKIAFSASQDLHGYSKPWIGGAGKNKIVFPYYTNDGLLDGVTYATDSEGKITATGTTTKGTNFLLNREITLKAGTYTFSITGKHIGLTAYVRDVDAGIMLATIWAGSSNANATFTLAEDCPNVNIYLNISNADVAVDISAYFQLESGSSPTSFEPYSNICPITGFSQANVVRTGANVWDEEWELGLIGETTGENVPSTINIRSKNYIPIKGGKSYYFYVGSGVNIRIFFYDHNKNPITLGTGNIYHDCHNEAYTAPANASYVRFRTYNTYGSTYGNNISINYPNTDHAYHAYNGNTYLLQFGDTYYGCEIDVVHGKLKCLYWGVVYDGTENGWNWAGSLQQAYIALPYQAYYDALEATYLCDRLTPCSNDARPQNIGNYASLVSSGASVAFSTPETSLENFKTWLSNNNLMFVYKLDTPIEVDIDSAIITALTGEVNQVYCDIPTSNVEELQFFETVGRHIQ